MTTTFSIDEVQQLRRCAAESCEVRVKGRQGWTKSAEDPMNLLAAFDCLRLREGMVLRAYQFREGGNGNGIVWAMSEDLPFPEPQDCQRLEDRFLGPPRPTGALDDIMEAIEGDGSPWSYLSASLFAREAGDFGAMWHGISWGTHTILGADPWSEQVGREELGLPERPRGTPEEWRWLEPKPTEWGPEVRVDESRVVVTFYTYSGLGTEAIYRHCDTYGEGEYRFGSERQVVAEGPGGFVF